VGIHQVVKTLQITTDTSLFPRPKHGSK